MISAAACGSDTPTGPSAGDPTAIAVTCAATSGGHDCRASLQRSSGPAQDVTTTATWTSSNTAVATVDAGGRVTHRGSGQAEIRATYEDLFGGAIILVNVSVSSVSVACAPQFEAHQCTATAHLSDGSNQNVTSQATWTSSNSAVATVNGDGFVRHRTTGQTEVRATYTHGPRTIFSGSVTLNIVVSLSGSSVVINEFATRGPGEGSTDDFVEVRNDTASPVDISGWRINEWGPSFGMRVVFVVPAGVVVAPGCHYLASFRPDVGGVIPDARLSIPMNDNGGLALQHADGTLIDQVGYHPDSIYREGTPMPSPGPEDSRSYARVGNDTNNNINDFVRQSRMPLNSGASCSVR